jgi:hypothetical protein
MGGESETRVVVDGVLSVAVWAVVEAMRPCVWPPHIHLPAQRTRKSRLQRDSYAATVLLDSTTIRL